MGEGVWAQTAMEYPHVAAIVQLLRQDSFMLRIEADRSHSVLTNESLKKGGDVSTRPFGTRWRTRSCKSVAVLHESDVHHED